MPRHERQPMTMFVRTTENCNAGCFMCKYAHKHGEPFLQEGQLEKIVSEAKQAGIQLIRFTGGETLLQKEIVDYVSYIKRHGIKTSLITNGYLLPRKAEALAGAGLDQVIVSIDASHAELHNKLRSTKNLFENAVKGIREMKEYGTTKIRINTVVSPHNIQDLPAMLALFSELDVDQWSIIPLKVKDNLWQYVDLNQALSDYATFRSAIKDVEKPKMLGYSAQWAGRNEEEVLRYFTTGIPFTPQGKCGLVDKVRFYVPQTDKLLACNCVPWRLENVDFQTEVGLSGLNDGTLSPLVEYLHANGPGICTGCEPNNAYLAEHPDTLDEDILSF